MFQNKLYVISGCSGSGKTTIMRSVMNNELVSFTTRKKRKGEINNVDYVFISKLKFFFLRFLGKIVEHTKYAGNYYGLTQKEIDTKLEKGNAFFICDYEGMKQIKKIYPHCITIFICAEGEKVRERMIKRGDSPVLIDQRMKTYVEEVDNRFNYDHIIYNNGSLEKAIDDVGLIVEGV